MMTLNTSTEKADTARIIARFRDGANLPPTGPCWLQEQLDDLWSPEFYGTASAPLFPGIEPDLLARLDEIARGRDRRYQERSGLERYVAIDCDRELVQSLLAALDASGTIDFAYEELGTTVASSGVCDIQELGNQDYLGMAPTGVDAQYAWEFDGGTGTGVRFVDLEEGWNVFHSDLIDAGITLISGENNKNSLDHGTAVLGIVAAQDNGKGLIGIAHGVPSARVVSLCQPGAKANVALALLQAILELRFGDVLLLEVEANSGVAPRPVEVETVVFELIRLATSLGIVIIEPAGNGGIGLDGVTVTVSGTTRSLDRGSPDFRDSGALLVGGSLPTFDVLLQSTIHPRHPQSNSGNRVDCFSWAEGVLTTWNSSVIPPAFLLDRLWGGLLAIRHHLFGNDLSVAPDPVLVSLCRQFAGTSAASAILAGVAICVQSLTQANLGFRLSPWQLRLLLADPENGTQAMNPTADFIGVMPDLRRIVDVVLRISAGPNDLYLPIPPPRVSSGGELLLQQGEVQIASSGYLLLPFQIIGGGNVPRRLEVLSRLPRETRVWLEMPCDLADLQDIWRDPALELLEEDNVYVPANPNGQSYFREAILPTISAWRLVVQFPLGIPTQTYEIAVRLLEGWKEVSRVTWQIP
jgi:serine protease